MDFALFLHRLSYLKSKDMFTASTLDLNIQVQTIFVFDFVVHIILNFCYFTRKYISPAYFNI